MKNAIYILLALSSITASFIACKKDSGTIGQPPARSGFVSGKVTDSRGNAMQGVKIVIEHTVWQNTYVYATTNENGYYKAALPSEPAGDWTAKAQVERSAYGQAYTFDLDPSDISFFNKGSSAVRNFTWKLSGKRPGSETHYGAHADLYQFGTDVPMNKVKLVFTPYTGENTLIDGSPAGAIESNAEDIAGTFMVKDIPIGKYSVKAVYPGKTLLLDNRHDEGEPETNKTVVFGKNRYLGEAEYNIEFWLSE